MINFKVQGELDDVDFTDNTVQPYKWEHFETIVKTFSYCFFHTCHKEKDNIDKFSTTGQVRFADAVKQKIQAEMEVSSWECMKYFFYPENEKLPTNSGQAKLMQRYLSVLLYFMLDQHKLLNYLQYNSNFIRDQSYDLDSYEIWESKLEREDFNMLRNLILSINNISYTFYEYILKRYQLNGVVGQVEYYNKLKTDLVMQVLFRGIHDGK